MKFLTSIASATTIALLASSASAAVISQGFNGAPIMTVDAKNSPDEKGGSDASGTFYVEKRFSFEIYDSYYPSEEYISASLEGNSTGGRLGSFSLDFAIDENYDAVDFGNGITIAQSSDYLWSSSVQLYSNFSEGSLLPMIGDSARLGFRMSETTQGPAVYERVCETIYVPGPTGTLMPTKSCPEQIVGYERGEEVVGFGFLEITRGSVNIMGVASNSNGSITTPEAMSAVPLPAGLPMLVAGLAALGVVRRRK